MPDGKQVEPPADTEDATLEVSADTEDTALEVSGHTEGDTPELSGGRIFSAYGVASAVLAALSVAAITLGALIWSVHRGDVDERTYQSEVMRIAADWTGVLINMNTGNIETSLQRLRDGTVGQLNVDFDSAVQPYREVVQRLQSRSAGRVQAVAMESVHHDLDAVPGARPPVPAEQLPPSIVTRTDTVLVVATSVAENVGANSQKVYWNLRLDVSDVDGKLLISRLGSIK